MARNLILFISSVIFLLLPWYYTDSGLPQPVDAVIILLFVIFMLLGFPGLKQIIRYSSIYQVFIVLSLYMIAIILFHFVINPYHTSMITAANNLYSIVLVTLFLLMFWYLYEKSGEQKFYNIMIILMLIGIFMPLMELGPFSSEAHFREQFTARVSLTFNNPNQLGFYALVNMAILFYLTLLAKDFDIKQKKIFLCVLFNINMVFVFVSISRAAYSAIVLYSLSYFVLFKKKTDGYWAWLITFILALVSVLVVFISSYEVLSHITHARITMTPMDYTGLLGDIYARELEGLTYKFNVGDLFFGSGYFSNGLRDNAEFHNNFVSIFYQTGVFGILLYILMNILLIKKLYQCGVFYLIPYFCYMFFSEFHYTYRTRANWLILATFIFVIMLKQRYARYKANLASALSEERSGYKTALEH